VGDDWPFGYADLEPFYDQNDVETGVSGLAGDPAYPPKPARPMPPIPLGRLGMAAARGFDSLGWHWWPVDAAVNTVAYDGRAACNHCGPCLIGCVNRAKSSSDATYWPKAIAKGVDLRPGCIAQNVAIEGGRASGVTYRSADGREHWQPAAYVVIAGNGIGTARLLLASGLESPALGGNLMFHPAAYLRGMFREELDGPVGPVGCAIYSHEFYETDPRRAFKRGIHLQVTRENALLTQAMRLQPAWGREALAKLREEFRHSIVVLVQAEDLPERHNKVSLTDRIESDGLAGVRLDYKVSDHSRQSLDFGMDRAEEMLRAAGAHRIERLALAPLTGWHLLGTARMGSDPATSVTVAEGRCHAAPNLLVADGRLFPPVGAVTPGSTIGALGLKIADDLARALA
jgi:choline dehydrogenase-like flavoprotein